MSNGKKVLGEERRKLILEWLKQSEKPLTGSFLAEKTNVSRQVISQDVSLLKARNEPIIATSQGYIFFKEQNTRPSRIISSSHNVDQTKEELYLIVDCGVTVKDVKVDHPIYGKITATVGVSNRSDVDQFLTKIQTTKASLLLQLTGGTHIHTLEADSENQLDYAIRKLTEAGFLVNP